MDLAPGAEQALLIKDARFGPCIPLLVASHEDLESQSDPDKDAAVGEDEGHPITLLTREQPTTMEDITSGYRFGPGPRRGYGTRSDNIRQAADDTYTSRPSAYHETSIDPIDTPHMTVQAEELGSAGEGLAHADMADPVKRPHAARSESSPQQTLSARLLSAQRNCLQAQLGHGHIPSPAELTANSMSARQVVGAAKPAPDAVARTSSRGPSPEERHRRARKTGLKVTDQDYSSAQSSADVVVVSSGTTDETPTPQTSPDCIRYDSSRDAMTDDTHNDGEVLRAHQATEASEQDLRLASQLADVDFTIEANAEKSDMAHHEELRCCVHETIPETVPDDVTFVAVPDSDHVLVLLEEDVSVAARESEHVPKPPGDRTFVPVQEFDHAPQSPDGGLFAAVEESRHVPKPPNNCTPVPIQESDHGSKPQDSKERNQKSPTQQVPHQVPCEAESRRRPTSPKADDRNGTIHMLSQTARVEKPNKKKVIHRKDLAKSAEPSEEVDDRPINLKAVLNSCEMFERQRLIEYAAETETLADELNESLNQYSAMNSRLTQENEGLKLHVYEQTGKCRALKKEKSALSTKLHELDKTVKGISNELKDVKEEIFHKQRKIDELNSLNDRLSASLEAAEAAPVAVSNERQAQIESSQRTVAELETKLQEKEAQVRRVQARVTLDPGLQEIFRSDMNGLQTLMDQLTQMFASYKQDVGEKLGQNMALQSEAAKKMDTFESTVTKLSASVQSLERKGIDSIGRVSSDTTAMLGLVQKLQENTPAVTKQQQEQTRLKEAIAGLSERLQNTATTLKHSEAQYQKMQTEHEELGRRHDKLGADFLEVQEVASDFEFQTESLKEHVANHEKTIGDLKREATNAAEAKQKFESDKIGLQSNLEAAKKQHEAEKRRLEENIRELEQQIITANQTALDACDREIIALQSQCQRRVDTAREEFVIACKADKKELCQKYNAEIGKVRAQAYKSQQDTERAEQAKTKLVNELATCKKELAVARSDKTDEDLIVAIEQELMKKLADALSSVLGLGKDVQCSNLDALLDCVSTACTRRMQRCKDNVWRDAENTVKEKLHKVLPDLPAQESLQGIISAIPKVISDRAQSEKAATKSMVSGHIKDRIIEIFPSVSEGENLDNVLNSLPHIIASQDQLRTHETETRVKARIVQLIRHNKIPAPEHDDLESIINGMPDVLAAESEARKAQIETQAKLRIKQYLQTELLDGENHTSVESAIEAISRALNTRHQAHTIEVESRVREQIRLVLQGLLPDAEEQEDLDAVIQALSQTINALRNQRGDMPTPQAAKRNVETGKRDLMREPTNASGETQDDQQFHLQGKTGETQALLDMNLASQAGETQAMEGLMLQDSQALTEFNEGDEDELLRLERLQQLHDNQQGISPPQMTGQDKRNISTPREQTGRDPPSLDMIVNATSPIGDTSDMFPDQRAANRPASNHGVRRSNYFRVGEALRETEANHNTQRQATRALNGLRQLSRTEPSLTTSPSTLIRRLSQEVSGGIGNPSTPPKALSLYDAKASADRLRAPTIRSRYEVEDIDDEDGGEDKPAQFNARVRAAIGMHKETSSLSSLYPDEIAEMEEQSTPILGVKKQRAVTTGKSNGAVKPQGQTRPKPDVQAKQSAKRQATDSVTTKPKKIARTRTSTRARGGTNGMDGSWPSVASPSSNVGGSARKAKGGSVSSTKYSERFETTLTYSPA